MKNKVNEDCSVYKSMPYYAAGRDSAKNGNDYKLLSCTFPYWHILHGFLFVPVGKS